MKRISIDGGKSFVTPEEALTYVVFDSVLAEMDPVIREKADEQTRGGSIFDLLHKYLELADRDLILNGSSRPGDDCRTI